MNPPNAEVEKPNLEGVSIVAIGSFNPAIFQPLWFSNNGLIRAEEASSANIKVITNEVAVFQTEWFGVQVISESLTFDTKDPTKARPLRDLVQGTFTILEHTPVKAFGFNSLKHIPMDSEDDWHAFGHHYAPKAAWNAILEKPGMRALAINGKRSDCEAKAINITVQPSSQIHHGVCIHVNEHYEAPQAIQENQYELIGFFLRALNDRWDNFLDYCEKARAHLLAAYKNGGA